jgi:NAD(P)-dependent dehydrogenase (short-subunit alcohol dehydrogenase family)
VAIVTGANTGIGRETARALAKMGAEVILACRNAEKTQAVLDDIRSESRDAKVEHLELDLASLASVRAAAKRFLDSGRPLHILVNNAGLAGKRGRTEDGFELAFGVNHLGHFLFTDLLLERLKASAPARVVNVSSASHYSARGIDFDALKGSTRSISGLPEYAVSKLANVLFTKELARRLEGTGVNVYALHPGVVASDAWRQIPWPVRSLMKLFMISTEKGAETTIWCATSDEVKDQTGLYYDTKRQKKPSRDAEDRKLAARLWEISAEWVAQK